MINLNRATMIGNLTRDPEMRYTPAGQSVTSFSVATNRRWTKDGEEQKETEFHNIVAWGKLAEIAHQILKKGNKAYVEGRIKTRSWEGQDGVKRQRTEIIAENLINLTSRGEQTLTDSEGTQPKKESFDSTTKQTAGDAGATGDKEKETKKTGKDDKDKSQPASSQAGVKNEKTKEDTGEEEIDIDDIPF